MTIHRSLLRTRTLAWSVHLLTASGVVWCLLAINATFRDDWRAAFGWLLVAVLIDGVDGACARWVGVKEVLPGFDGALMDNVIDYANYVIVPALILQRSGVLASPFDAWIPGAVCIASAYQFCQVDAKTPDHSFKGFPSYWNIAALYLMALKLPAGINTALLITLIVLVFVPTKYIYPTRTPYFQTLTLVLTCLWGLAATAIIWQLPEPSPWLVHVSMVYFFYYVAMSLHLMYRSD